MDLYNCAPYPIGHLWFFDSLFDSFRENYAKLPYYDKNNCRNNWRRLQFYYRAMHFSAKRGIAIACRLSVCPSVTLVYCDHIGWNSSKIISPLVSLGRSLFATPTWRVCSKGNTRNFRPNGGGVLKKRLSAYKSSNISETRQDRTKVTIEVE